MAKTTRDHQSWLLERLSDPERAVGYLKAAMDDSPEIFLEALKDVAQAHTMSKVAKEAQVARESLYRSLSREGNPTFAMLLSVMKVLGLKLKPELDVKGNLKRIPKPSRGHVTRKRSETSNTGQLALFADLAVPINAGSSEALQSITPKSVLVAETTTTAIVRVRHIESDHGSIYSFNPALTGASSFQPQALQ